ncbi:MAG: DUF4430 domain-containing protein [Candidatus Thorarchaeota archaeon]
MLVPLILLSQPAISVGELESDAIIAAESISLSVDFGNGTTAFFDNLTGSNVLEVTSIALNVEVQWYGPLAYVRGIEGIIGEGVHGWEYWVNGEFASVAVNLYTLEDHDSVEWIYTSPEPQNLPDPSLVPGASFVLIAGIGFIALVYVQTSRRLK